MMLTISGLPPSTKYKDLKVLIKSRCNLTEFILDDLCSENGLKKVRIGLTDTSEGAHLIKCLAGYRMSGYPLSVTPVGRTQMSTPQQNFEPKPSFNQVQPHDYNEQRPAQWGPQSNQQSQWRPNAMPQQDPQHSFGYQHQQNASMQNNPYMSQQQHQDPVAPQHHHSQNQFQQPQQMQRSDKQYPPARDAPPNQNYGYQPKNNIPENSAPRSHALRTVEVVDTPIGRPVAQPGRYPGPSFQGPEKPMTIMKDNFQGPSQYFLEQGNSAPPQGQGQQNWMPQPYEKPGYNEPKRPHLKPQEPNHFKDYERGPPREIRKSPDRSPGRPLHAQERRSPGRPLRAQERRSPGRPLHPQERRSPGRPLHPQERRSPGRPLRAQERRSPGRPVRGQERRSPGRPVHDQERHSPGRSRRISPGRRPSPSRRPSPRRVSPTLRPRDRDGRMSPGRMGPNPSSKSKKLPTHTDTHTKRTQMEVAGVPVSSTFENPMSENSTLTPYVTMSSSNKYMHGSVSGAVFTVPSPFYKKTPDQPAVKAISNLGATCLKTGSVQTQNRTEPTNIDKKTAEVIVLEQSVPKATPVASLTLKESPMKGKAQSDIPSTSGLEKGFKWKVHKNKKQRRKDRLRREAASALQLKETSVDSNQVRLGSKRKTGEKSENKEGSSAKRSRLNETISLRSDVEKPKFESIKKDFAEAAKADLLVAITTKSGNLTKQLAQEVEQHLQNLILKEAMDPSGNRNAPPLFRGKPVVSDGALRLWCENETTKTWLARSLRTITLSTGEKVILKLQSEIGRKVRCGVLLPGIWDDFGKLAHMLEYQNPWAGIERWQLHNLDKQETGTFAVVSVPETVVQALMEHERRLSFMIGSVYVKFQGAKGKFVEYPPNTQVLTDVEETAVNLESTGILKDPASETSEFIQLESGGEYSKELCELTSRGEEDHANGGVPFCQL